MASHSEKTGRRRSARPARAARHAEPDPAPTVGAETEPDLEDDLGPAAPRRGAKRTVVNAIRQLPNFLRLLYGLMTDPRVAPVDKLLVGGAIAYILFPLDWIPDFIPFMGEVDDVFVLVLALRRLIENAGRAVLLEHWSGSVSELADLNLRRLLSSAAFFLPRRLRRRLRPIGRP